MHNQSTTPTAAPRFVRVTKVTLALARATLQLREFSVTRMQLREAIGESANPSWQEVVREWLRGPEATRASAHCGLPMNEDALSTLLGCDRWPQEIWRTEWPELPERFEVDLYKQTVVRVSA